MQIRQSSLTQFGDTLVRFMVEAGSHDPEMKYSLDYMHSRYDGKKVLTLISPETGAMAVFGQAQPTVPFSLTITANHIVPGDTVSWHVDLPDLGIKQKHRFAQWLIDMFKTVNYLDSDEEFKAKLDQLAKDAAEQGLGFTVGATYNTFRHQLYDI